MRGLLSLKECPVIADMLVRCRSTVSQGHLLGRAREWNDRSVFKGCAVRKVFLQGKMVILIDDVLTTGTMVEAYTCALRVDGAP